LRIRSRYFTFYNSSGMGLVILNENLVFDPLVWRPLSVTGAILFPNENEPSFHQMTIDRIDNGEYVLQNTQFSDDPSAASFKMPGMVSFAIINF